jgi:hypothetical protein
MTKILALILAVAVGGCSWGARAVRAVASKPCSPSRVWPAIDAAVAVAGAGAVGYGLSAGDERELDSQTTIIFLGAVVFSAAAISSYVRATDCRDAAPDGARHASTLAPRR